MKLCLYGTAHWDRIYGIPVGPDKAVLCKHVTNPTGTLTCLEIKGKEEPDWNGAKSFTYNTIGTQGDIRIVQISGGRVINGASTDNVFPEEWRIAIAKTVIGPVFAYLRGSGKLNEFEVVNEMGLCRGLMAVSGDSGSLVYNGAGEIVGFVSTAISITPIPAQYRPPENPLLGVQGLRETTTRPVEASTPVFSPETLPAGVISLASPNAKTQLTLEEDLIQSTRAVLRRHGLL